MQFFVTVRDTSWTILGVQIVEGIAILLLASVSFELVYRPQPAAND